ncbi:MAG: DUF2029 domain-containing protein [Chloroflexi bacterium]|nr:DUF2029 domain-containing protein [Chloroflexota bacterium]
MRSQLLLGVLALAGLVFLVTFVRSLSGPAVDFDAYYEGGLAVRAGERPYALALRVAASGYAMGAPNTPDGNASAYVYPPLLALVVAPLTLLPIERATAVWSALLHLGVLAAAWLLADLFGPRDRRGRLLVFGLVLLWLLLFKPIRGALGYTRQVDVLLLLLLVVMAWGVARRRLDAAGLALGLAIAVKPFFVLIALYFLWKRAYRGFVVAGLTATICGLLPLVVLGALSEYLAIAAYWGGPTFAVSPVSQSFTSLLLRLFTESPFTVPVAVLPGLVLPLRVIYVVGVAFAILAVARPTRGLDPVTVVLEIGLFVLATMLIGPLAEESHLAYLALGLAGVGAAAVALSADDRHTAMILGGGFVGCTLLLHAPGLHELSWGNWQYLAAPLRFPYALVTGLYLYIQWAIGLLLLLALPWWYAAPTRHAVTERLRTLHELDALRQ